MIRRDFIKAVPASLFLTGFPNLGFTKTNKDGRLIVINLEGGMDGLCAVPPLGDTALRSARRVSPPDYIERTYYQNNQTA